MRRSCVLRKVKGTDNEADMGTKVIDGPTHQRLMLKARLKPTQCRRLLSLIATANSGSVVEAQMSGDEEKLGKFSEQMWVLMDVHWSAPARTVEQGTQTVFNPVNQITVPSNVYCSPGGECCHTSRKCERLKNVPMGAVGRSCSS